MRAILAAAAAAVTLAAFDASAEQLEGANLVTPTICGQVEQLAAFLGQALGQRPIGAGALEPKDGGRIGIYVNSGSGGFSIVLLEADGRACVLAGGQRLELWDDYRTPGGK